MILIDGDTIVYRCAFAAQKSSYQALLDNGDVLFETQYKKDFDKWAMEQRVTDSWTPNKVINIEPVEYALSNAKTAMSHILSFFEGKDYRLWLGEGKTFRHHLATIQEYKGHRPEKPEHYEAVREYLVKVWGAEYARPLLEVDDELGIYQSNNKGTTIVSNDKDLRQIEGWHFDWTTQDAEPIHVSKEESDYFWGCQLLTGDATDNIEGIPGLGDKTAQKLLRGYYGEPRPVLEEVCGLIYEDYFFSEKKIPRRGDLTYNMYMEEVLGISNPLDLMKETKGLITILRKEEEYEVVQQSSKNIV